MQELPNHWKRTTLGEVCSVVTDGTHKTPKYIDKGVPFISIANIQPFSPISFKRYEKYISTAEHNVLIRRANPEKDDILFPRIGTLGYAKRVDWDFDFSIFVGLGLAKPLKDIVRPKFLEYYMNTPFVSNFSTRNANGSGRLTLPLEASRLMPVPLPPIDEQEGIVARIEELFSELDAGVESLKKAQAQLKTYRQAVLKSAFDDPEDKLSKYLLKDASLKIQIGPFGTQLHREDYVEGGIPLINPMHIKDGRIVANSSYSITVAKRDSLANYILKDGDVILGRRGEMGRSGLVTEKEAGWLCGSGSLYFRPKKDLVDSAFLHNFLQSQTAKKYLEENAGGTTMANLNLKIVGNIPISLPSINQQRHLVEEIESRLSVCDKLEETIGASLKQSEALRQSILKQAFEGKLI
ncbi:MAG TPA: restriction endonuclease subunit S [Pyrinomonadaceae bacterium]|nr:restriction endonuclease subunit S [Pyrinomonadaceae bacterium]